MRRIHYLLILLVLLVAVNGVLLFRYQEKIRSLAQLEKQMEETPRQNAGHDAGRAVISGAMIAAAQTPEGRMALLQQAAEAGDAVAQGQLGMMYMWGQGVPKDEQAAFKWFQKSAEGGDAFGQVKLGTLYSAGTVVPKDMVEAAKWFQKSAAQGHHFGQRMLGLVYETGEGLPQNLPEAFRLYKLSADQGNPFAPYFLGHLYERGWGTERNLPEAFKWYTQGASVGDGPAEYALCVMDYLWKVDGTGGQTLKWCRVAAEKGYAYAQKQVGFFYATGLGMKQNDAEAAKWYRRAALQGDALSQFYTGGYAARGEGVRLDLIDAHMWFSVALANKDLSEKHRAEAQQQISLIEKKLLSAELDEAKRRRAAFVPKEETHQ